MKANTAATCFVVGLVLTSIGGLVLLVGVIDAKIGFGVIGLGCLFVIVALFGAAHRAAAMAERTLESVERTNHGMRGSRDVPRSSNDGDNHFR